jgi:acyl-CoA thioesterase
VAQALRAGTFTVDDRYRVHSLHAYFIDGTHVATVSQEVLRPKRS